MLDPRLLRQDPDRIRASQRARGESESLVDDAVRADEDRRAAIAEYERLRAEQKELGKQIPKASGEEKAALLARTKELAEAVKKADAGVTEAEGRYRELMGQFGNLVADGVPAGGEDDYVVLETHGTPRDFEAEGFKPRDHVELGAMLGAIDLERGAKVSGSRFYYLTGQGAELELAMVNLAVEHARRHGFTLVIPPSLVKPAAMDGTGFLGQAAQDVYRLEADDLYLAGRAEVRLPAHRPGEIVDAERLPRHYAACSPSCRRAAGAHGKDTRGIIRVHWFAKVATSSVCDPAEADAEHRRPVAW